MTDLYLQSLMQGKTNDRTSKKKKNRFEIATEEVVNSYVDSIEFGRDESEENKFATPEMKRAKLKAEILEEAELSELSEFVDSAFKLLMSEGAQYLEREPLEVMNADFAKGQAALDEINLNSPPSANFQTLLHFSDSTMESIFKIAVAKFEELKFSESLSLFILLATLVPEDPDYWLRAGIVAHKSEKYELATRLYSAAISLDSTLAAPWIYLIDCYLNREMDAEAKTAYVEAIKINEAFPDEKLKEMLCSYQAILT